MRRRDERLDRRVFLKLTGAAAATTALGAGLTLVSRPAFGLVLTKAQRDALTPDEIIALMKKGNERFRHGKESPHDYLAQQRASAKGQYPAAVILSCIDSRAPAETIMDLGIGNCFNARVAGNIANDDILGSMEFACKVAGAKVVLVMGHTACGAIKGASSKARNTLVGAAAGSAIAGSAQGSKKGMLYQVEVGAGQIVQVVSDQREIRSGDCVSVEKSGDTANIRRVSPSYCDKANQAAVAAVSNEARKDAEECAAAKQQLVDSKTAQEVDLAGRKISLLCND